jgi:hypothetical protein
MKGVRDYALTIVWLSREGQTRLSASILGYTQLQAACVAAKQDPGEFKGMRATQLDSGERMMNRARWNLLLLAETVVKRSTSSYTIWGPIRRRGLYAKI